MDLSKIRIITINSPAPEMETYLKSLNSSQCEIVAMNGDHINVNYMDHNSPDLLIVTSKDGDSDIPWDFMRKYRIEGLPTHFASSVLHCPNLTSAVRDNAFASGFDFIIPANLSLDALSAYMESALNFKKAKRELADTQIKISRYHDRLKKLSLNDELTGLYNLRYIRKLLRAEFKRAERYGNNLSVLCIDIDDFRKINESFDHLMGSYVLSKIGLQIGSSLRTDIDYAARIGSDEFLIILPETDAAGAKVVSDRLQRRIGETVFDNGTYRVQVAISVGLAHFDGEQGSITDPDSLQRAAEASLKQAKDARLAQQKKQETSRSA